MPLQVSTTPRGEQMFNSNSYQVVFFFIYLLGKAAYTGQDCILPEHPANGRYEPTDSDCPYKFNSSACQGIPGISVKDGWYLYLKCNEGFVSTNGEHRQSSCVEGYWRPPLPLCFYNFTNDHDKCIAPRYPDNGKYKPLPIECDINYKSSENMFRPGSFVPSLCILVYYCNSGYQLDDENTISVCDKGKWNPKNVTCQRKTIMGVSISERITALWPPNITLAKDQFSQSSGARLIIERNMSTFTDFINIASKQVICSHEITFKNDVHSCKLPDPAGNRRFTNYTCDDCVKNPGEMVSHSQIISVTCTSGHYMLQGVHSVGSNALTTCHNGNWSPTIPLCYKLCQPLKSLTVAMQCWNGLTMVNCSKPALPGTIVKYSCKEYYESSSKQQFPNIRCDSGEWSGYLPNCKPKCGLANSNSIKIVPSIIGGETSEAAGVFPWHVGLYHNKSNRWEAVCGGTLISTRVVLTAAHCVTVPCYGCPSQPMRSQEIMVVLGKIHRDWQVSEESEQRIAIKEIHAQEDYVGRSLNYYHDIAMLVLHNHVTVNKFVLPVCVDFHEKYVLEMALNKSLVGYVAGWGNTEECTAHGRICNSTSDTLKYAKTTVLNFHDCLNASQAIKRLQGISLTTDKYCAGNGSESVAQQGDSGGGQTFKFDGLHYIYGIVSIKLKLEINNKVFYSFSAFTNVTKYINWINNVYTNWED